MSPDLETLPAGAAAQAGARARVEVEELPRWRRRLRVVVPPERVARERNALTRDYGRRLKLPGFRPGRAPADVVRKRFGREIEDDLARRLLQEALREALEERKLEPISPPRAHSLEPETDGGLRAVVELDVRPELRLARLHGFRIEREVPEVPPDAVDRVLERLREERAEVRPAERPAARGDVLLVDVEPLEGGGEPAAGYEVALGSGQAGSEVESQLEGVRAGEVRELAVAGDGPGQSRRFRVHVREVRERVLPDLDDAFAAAVSRSESLGALREAIGENLRREAEAHGERRRRESLLEAIAEANRVEVPESMVERYVEGMLHPDDGPAGAPPGRRRDARGVAAPSAPPSGGHVHAHPHEHPGPEGAAPPGERPPGRPEEEEEVARILRTAAEHSLRRLLVIEAVAREQGLEPSEEQIDEHLAARLEPGRAVVEARRALERAGRLEDLRHQLRAENVFRFLEDPAASPEAGSAPAGSSR